VSTKSLSFNLFNSTTTTIGDSLSPFFYLKEFIMCLIITGKSSKVRSTLLDTHGLLSDIFTSNPDGIGFMYGSAKGLKVTKTLPKNIGDATAFIQRLPQDDREIAIHFRWTTHGKTDMLNCHPYDVIPGFIAMMHNGVLHTGNAADKTKSDTWHFIKDYLHSAVSSAPDLVYDTGFVSMMEEFIGNNRFVFMNGEGRMQHVNFDQGVEHDDMWFSNTYAWTPSRLIPSYKSTTALKSYAKSYNNAYNSYMDDYDEMYDYNASFGIYPRNASAHSANYDETAYDFPDDEDGFVRPDAEEIANALFEADVETMEIWLDQMPAYTITTMLHAFEASPLSYSHRDDLCVAEQGYYDMLIEGDASGLISAATKSYNAVNAITEVVCYYLQWDARKPVTFKPTIPALLT
jgi:predicted glutamine amidotransferase